MAAHHPSRFCGCWFPSSSISNPMFGSSVPARSHLPLKHLKIHSTILSTTCRTTFQQTFVNNSDHDLQEIAYSFPIYSGVSVVSFTATVGNVKVVGVVKEKQQARQEYREAVDRGESAGLLEQLSDFDDVLTTKIGNVPAHGTVVVELVHVSELQYDAEANAVRLTIPNYIAPRYGHSTQDTLYGQPLAQDATQGIEIIVDVQVSEGAMIEQVQSPSHPISVGLGRTSVSLTKEAMVPHRASASLSLDTTFLEKEFTLLVKAKDTQTPKAWLETHPRIPNQRALMATLVPNFKLPPSHGEIVFVLDQSGSMYDRVQLVISAMKIMLKSLPIGVKFNICSFGSSYRFKWEKSQPYNQETLDKAIRYVETRVGANMGGTEIANPLEAVVARRYEDIRLNVIMLTDGAVHNQDELFKRVESFSEAGTMRFFTLGIGSSASTSLVEGLAKAGQGLSQFVTDGEKMEKKMSRLLRSALSSSIRDFNVELKYAAKKNNDEDDFEIVESVGDASRIHTSLPIHEAGMKATTAGEKPKISMFDADADDDNDDDEGGSEGPKPVALPDLPEVETPSIIQAPHKTPPIFPHSRRTVYFLLGPGSQQNTPKSVVFRGTSDQGPLEFEINVQDVGKGETIHQLAAKKAAAELELEKGWVSEAKDKSDGVLLRTKYDSKYADILRREAVALGVQYQVGGKWCSFVAVRQGDDGDGSIATMRDGRGDTRRSYSTNIDVSQKPSSVRSRFRRAIASTRDRDGAMSRTASNSSGAALFGSASTQATGAAFGSRNNGSSSLFGNSNTAPKPMGQEVSDFNMEFSNPLASHNVLNDFDFDSFLHGNGDGKQFGFDAAAFGTEQRHEIKKDELETATATATAPEEQMHELIALQRFDGSWAWDLKFFNLLVLLIAAGNCDDTARRRSSEAAKNLISRQDEENAADFGATCMAIAFLKCQVPDLEDVWELAVEKAETWLQSQPGVSTAEEMIGKAKKELFSQQRQF